jgi:hypothetical protein
MDASSGLRRSALTPHYKNADTDLQDLLALDPAEPQPSTERSHSSNPDRRAISVHTVGTAFKLTG